jgi:hypothetical protein
MHHQRRILCLGSSHTEGGFDPKTLTKPFENSWPGYLEHWLRSQDRHCDVINLGEASYSIEQYALKLLMSLQRWPDITDVIVEFNSMHKIDVEISEQLHGNKVVGPAIEDRWTVATNQGRTPFTDKQRTYRTSVSNTEAVDYYTSYYKTKHSPQNVDTIKRIATEMRDGILNETTKQYVIDKLGHLVEHMPGTDRALEILMDYMYFRAVYESMSDHNVIKYLQNIDHITEICRNANINCWMYFQHPTDEWSGSDVYKNVFKPRWSNNWLLDKERFALKPWLIETHGEETVKSWLADSIHFVMEPYEKWIQTQLGPWLISQWNSKVKY